jgi:hypothetical protein
VNAGAYLKTEFREAVTDRERATDCSGGAGEQCEESVPGCIDFFTVEACEFVSDDLMMARGVHKLGRPASRVREA